ncbi:MAG TPA: DHA2 family efflux MFS transporter permease subunit [Polyangia bacterium]|jgi:EmrB/QacA subfamily drug resistance transporter
MTSSALDDDGPLAPALVRVLLIASFGSFLLNLSSTTVNVAIDPLMKDLHAPLSEIQWIITGYLLALTLVLPSFRWAVERLGSRRLYVWCLVGFTATSALSSLAWSAPSLIAFRVLQGTVGGLLTPLTQALIAQLAGPKRMGRAVGIMSVPVLVAPVLGPVLGGLVIQRLSWRWLFLFNIPFGLAGAWLAQRRLPSGETAARTPLDLVGLALLSPGVALFVWGVSAFGRAHGAFSPRVIAPLAIAVALIASFVAYARRRPTTALLDLNVFRNRTVSAALATYLLASLGTFGAALILPLYYQQVRGASPLTAGMLIAPQGIGMMLTLPQVGRLSDRFDPGKVCIAGVLTALAGTIAFTQATDHSSYLLLSLSLVVRGAGLGATSTPALAAAYKHLRRDEIPNATTALNIVQRLGAPIGTATMAVTLQRFAVGAGKSPALLARAFAHTFTVSAALGALALFAAFRLIAANNPERTTP